MRRGRRAPRPAGRIRGEQDALSPPAARHAEA